MNDDAIKVRFKPYDYHFHFELQFTFQPTVVITIQSWTTVTERVVTSHPREVKCVATCYLRDGIVLWELQGQKCQQRVCQHSDVVQTGQVGWMVLILQRKMVMFACMSAVAIVPPVANIECKFQFKIVDPTSSTNCLKHQAMMCATVELIKRGDKKVLKNWKWRIYEFLCKYTCYFIFV